MILVLSNIIIKLLSVTKNKENMTKVYLHALILRKIDMTFWLQDKSGPKKEFGRITE